MPEIISADLELTISVPSFVCATGAQVSTRTADLSALGIVCGVPSSGWMIQEKKSISDKSLVKDASSFASSSNFRKEIFLGWLLNSVIREGLGELLLKEDDRRFHL